MEVKSAEEFRSELLAAALEKLKSKATQVVDDVMGQLYCDYLPHVETDTESNITNRVEGVIRNLIAGNMEKVTETAVAVSDGYGRNHFISINSWSGMAKPLCDLMGPQIVGARVEQLENQVARLKADLESAYRR